MPNPTTEHLTLTERFERAYRIMRSQGFLEMRGQLGEVPYFILSNDPADQPRVAAETRRLVTKLRTDGLDVCVVDLWRVATELWEGTGQWDAILGAEGRLRKERFAKSVGNVISPEPHLSPRIAEVVGTQDPRPQLVVLTNVGRLYPLVRAHTILNTLQPLLADRPIVLVFPGTYRQSATQGSSLVLFDLLTNDDYYRAFDLLDLEYS
ncbi:MAG TPA: DUF1788 domain-containing protein [Gordonia sp. (in: high G+C Gram-positive bacteria)]|jgi:hypothetical protein|nr:DUF1788 domain-containing protein [Gordonia sp. (in: high G+C Gram-positive bacteria)]